MSVMNSDIEGNGDYGIRLQVSSSVVPTGNGNNILNNGGGADARQLYVMFPLPTANWINNYFGTVQEGVQCPWAPGDTYPYHLSYSASNPYSAAPKAGPVSYNTHWNFATGERCATDRVADQPYADEPFINEPPSGEGECDDDERSTIINEYQTGVVYTPGITPVPTCNEIEYHPDDYQYLPTFTWGELNDHWGPTNPGNPHTYWGVIRESLKLGLLSTRAIYDDPIVLSSGYRCPHGNSNISGDPNSHHMRGRAADMYSTVGSSWTEEQFNVLKAAAEATRPAPDESFDYDEYPKDRHYHAAW